MNKNISIVDENGNIIDAKLVFSFSAYGHDYIVVDYSFNLFEENSKYNNLNIFEVSKMENNKIHVVNINYDDWPKIKDFLQREILGNIN